jgi:protein gp37
LPQIWGGASTERRFFGDAHWAEPYVWDRAAAKAGVRRRVFCMSMADVGEDRPDLMAPRARLRHLVDRTPHLDWLLLTKRPENIDRLWLQAQIDAFDGSESMGPTWSDNVWLGTTVEDQKSAETRIPHLAAVGAKVKFLSCEPLLEPINLFGPALDDTGPAVDWVIVGGESGPNARPFWIEWAESIVQQCRNATVAPFVKQLGSNCGLSLRLRGRKPLRHRHGADPSEWPAPLRIQEFPEAA